MSNTLPFNDHNAALSDAVNRIMSEHFQQFFQSKGLTYWAEPVPEGVLCALSELYEDGYEGFKKCYFISVAFEKTDGYLKRGDWLLDSARKLYPDWVLPDSTLSVVLKLSDLVTD